MRPNCSSKRKAALTVWVRLLACALAGLLPAFAHAECGCLWEGSFADVQANADLIVAGTVATHKGNAADFMIEDTLRGPDYHETVRVWLQTGDYCRPPIEDFPLASRWVLALKSITELPPGGFDPGTPSLSFGRVGDYYLSSCGGYWLDYSGEAVTGNLIDAPRWARDPDMTPVLIDLLRAYVQSKASRAALKKASREDPELIDLRLNTKAFLRGDDDDDEAETE
ncbi:MAG: delta-aminolevulinic acid dehydratase [Congregibacter sp.]